LRVRAAARIRPVMHGSGEGPAQPWFRADLRLLGIRSLGIQFPPRSSASLTVGLRGRSRAAAGTGRGRQLRRGPDLCVPGAQTGKQPFQQDVDDLDSPLIDGFLGPSRTRSRQQRAHPQRQARWDAGTGARRTRRLSGGPGRPRRFSTCTTSGHPVGRQRADYRVAAACCGAGWCAGQRERYQARVCATASGCGVDSRGPKAASNLDESSTNGARNW
jgi:hypothetical protein